MTPRAFLAFALALAVASPAAHGGEEPQQVTVGARLRVRPLDGPRTIGFLEQIEARTRTLANGPRRVVLERSNVRTIEVSRGTRGHPWIGLAVGALVGAGFAACSSSEPPDCNYEVIPIGALVGAGVGAFIRTERWRRVALPPEPTAIDRR